MPKKSPKYITLSGWLPASYSHYRTLESYWVGYSSLTTDEFYNVLKMIADDLNDGIRKKTIIKNVEKYLKDSDLSKYRPVARDYFIGEVFTFVSEYYEISKYYKDN